MLPEETDSVARGGNGRGPAVTRQEAGTRVLIEASTIWLAAAIFVGIGIGWVLLTRTTDILLLVFSAIVLAEGLRPVVDRLAGHRVPRPISVLAIYAVSGAALAGLGWLLVQPLLSEAQHFANNLPQFVNEARHLIEQARQAVGHSPIVANALNALQGQIGGIAGNVASLILHAPLTVGGALFKLLEVVFLAFFWLTATSGLKRFVIDLFPDSARATVDEVLGEMAYKLGGYVRGTLINMLVVGALTGIGLWLLGVPYPVLLGTVSALTESLPLIGTFIGQGVAIGVTLLTRGWISGLEVYLLTMLIQQFEGNVLVPVVMNRAVDLNPFSVGVAILLGASLFGLMGAVMAVPLAVLIKVLVVRVLAPAARRASQRRGRHAALLVAGDQTPLQPASEDS